MDSGLKERLVGAAVLVVLGIWLIPWLLNGSDSQAPPPGGSDAELSLPAAGVTEPGTTRTETIVLADSSRSHAPANAAASRSAARRERSGAAGGSSDAPATPGDGATGDTGPDPSAATAAAGQHTAPDAPAAAATANTGSDDAAHQAATADSGWSVQLGSFSEEANAKRLSDRVASVGYSPAVTVHRSGGRTLHRVRVGPWPSRQEAEAAASTLGDHGFLAQVIATD